MKLLKIAPIGELCTLDPEFDSLGDNKLTPGLGRITDAAIVIEDDKIVWVGKNGDLPKEYSAAAETIDARYYSVVPGLIDCHTHTIFGGTRVDEFERRLRGETYTEILAAGGGILSTIQKTREFTEERLFQNASGLINFMRQLGVTTVEIKSGYGLATDAEMRILRIAKRLSKETPTRIVPTFLGAHAVPLEYRNRADDYISLIIERMLPMVLQEKLAEFCDVFVEKGTFSVDQAREVLTAAKTYGMKPKLHAEQLSHSGSIKLAVEVGAVSAGHLEYINTDDIELMAKNNIVGVLLPGATLFMREKKKPPVREMIEAGVKVAVGTDFNPGSSPTPHLPLCGTLACTLFDMLPHEVMKAITTNAASALALDDKLGKIKKGYLADLVILGTGDYRNLFYRFPAQLAKTILIGGNQV